MSKIKSTIDRRSFLKATGLAGGGMIIGFNFFKSCKPEVKPPIDISQLNFNDFNGFIKISDNGIVTIFAPNPEIGQGVKTSMPMIIAEELDVEWENVHVVQGGLDTDVFERQVAGGSQSIRHGWDPLRQTGATAKQMLVNAAAARWGIDASTCSVSNGVISNNKGGFLGYGDVVNEAALMEVPKDVQLKDPKDYKIIGQEVKNVDIDKIITGKPLFGLDFKREGMLYSSVLRPPAFGQKLESVDLSKARTQEGVVDVFQFGDKVAVLAKSNWEAMRAKKTIVAKWKKDSTLESTKDHDKILLDLLNGNEFKSLRSDGDIKKAFANADRVLERTYDSPFLPHNCLEPMNFFANVTDEKVELVGPIQTPKWTADRISKKLERNIDEISLEMTRMGGGFGRRLYGDFALEAAEISNIARKPVQVVFSREDDMADGIYRPAIKYRISAAIKNDKIVGYHLKEAAINGGMYDLVPNFFPAGAIENYQVDSASYKSNITTGAWRAPYTNFLSFAEQSFFDELAETLNVDQVKLRLDLLENVKGNNDEKIQYSAERMEGVINKVVEKSNWGKVGDDIYQGFSAYYCHNTHVAEVADVRLESGIPVIDKVTCVIDCGIVVNPLGALNQVEGGVIDGIGHAMFGNLDFKDGVPQSVNFDTYRLIRMKETPKVETHFIESNVAPTGLGEPALPPAGGALANALKAATGVRLLKQPFITNKEIFGLKKV
jgi:isoquinoline 1-oxidoreductase beta subunit